MAPPGLATQAVVILNIEIDKAGLPSLTVVIATLGHEVIIETINRISRGTLIPQEIIIVAPVETEHLRHVRLKFPTVKTIFSGFRGQVRQRSLGFRLVETDLCLQLDDDICVTKNALLEMVNFLRSKGPTNCVTGCLHTQLGCLHSEDTTKLKVVKRAILGFKRPFNRRANAGRVSKSSVALGFNCSDLEFSAERSLEIDWSPGGCRMYWTNDLYVGDFFPFAGKAYFEDVLHSRLLRSEGIRIWGVANAIVETGVPEHHACLSEVLKEARVRIFYVLSFHKRNLPWVTIWATMRLVKYLFVRR